jgi:DNA-binding NarL/FixJ family response regulator
VTRPTATISEISVVHRADGSRVQGQRRPKTYVVTDVLLYREGLSSHLQEDDRVDFVGAGPPTEVTLAKLKQLSPDAVVVDLAMRDSIRFVQQIHDCLAGVKVVAFAVSDLDSRVVAYAKAGICGYVPKDGTAEDVILAVLHAVRGELHCTPRFAAILLDHLAALAPDSAVLMIANERKLTARELEILEHIDRGMSNKEIAHQLGISSATVKNHVHQLLGKLSVRRRTQALAFLRGRVAATVA